MTILSRVVSRVLGLVALIASLAVVTILPASAQSHVPRYGEEDKDKTTTEKAAEKEAQRAYERSLGNIPEQKGSDPWGIARDNSAPKETSKAATKTASPKPKAKTDIKTDGAAKQ
jgi:hypothetical protein